MRKSAISVCGRWNSCGRRYIADKITQYTRIHKNSSIAWTPIVIVTHSASLNIPNNNNEVGIAFDNEDIQTIKGGNIAAKESLH